MFPCKVIFSILFSVHIKHCGGHLTSSPGQILSPDEDQDGIYDNNVDCTWTVIADEGSTIQYRITRLSILGSFHCYRDKLEVGSVLYYVLLFMRTVYAIEKLLTGFNVEPRIGMNQSLIWLYYHATLLMTSHWHIQHPTSSTFLHS